MPNSACGYRKACSGTCIRASNPGAALRPIRSTRLLLQVYAISCRSSLVLRMGCKAAPGAKHNVECRAQR
ncbi:hypothetical protein E5221_11060 [Pseudomonas sp. A2]|nr:hypothetical protein E5221_11060 [Pseudomonas sp. A2]